MRKTTKGIVILLAGVFITLHGNAEASSKISKSEALQKCQSSVPIAIQAALKSGASDAQAYQAGEKALEDCMARYEYYPQ